MHVDVLEFVVNVYKFAAIHLEDRQPAFKRPYRFIRQRQSVFEYIFEQR